MITINTTNGFVVVGGFLRLDPTGGESPYTFSIVAGQDGGSIGADGIFYAPISTTLGYQDILVTDNLAETATKRIYIFSQLQIVCEIIRSYLNLSADQIYIYNQKINIPPDARVYCAVGIQSSKPFSNRTFQNGSSESVITNYQTVVKIDILGRTQAVIGLKDKLVSAFISNTSQKLQAENNFKIAQIPFNMVDLSSIEGSAIPYRFNISLNILYSSTETRAVEYYDTFRPLDILPESKTEAIDYYLLADTLGYLLQEDGSRIIL